LLADLRILEAEPKEFVMDFSKPTGKAVFVGFPESPAELGVEESVCLVLEQLLSVLEVALRSQLELRCLDVT
jgi:hypothetical protein